MEKKNKPRQSHIGFLKEVHLKKAITGSHKASKSVKFAVTLISIELKILH